jgi:DNA mismatch endonuclease (patch repair protein)
MAVPCVSWVGRRIHESHTGEQRSRMMSGIRSVSRLEVRARAIAESRAACKLRHGTNANTDGLPGRPDYFNKSRKTVVFVHGCFFHGCPRHFSMPRTNREFWERKIRMNRARDRSVRREYARMGWKVLTVWEHSVR